MTRRWRSRCATGSPTRGTTFGWPTTGRPGYVMASEGDHDLIILDVMLPKMSGLDVCKKIRRAAAADVPVIMLTAEDRRSTRSWG